LSTWKARNSAPDDGRERGISRKVTRGYKRRLRFIQQPLVTDSNGFLFKKTLINSVAAMVKTQVEELEKDNLLKGPPAGKAIAAGFAAIHSQPPLILYYLVFTCLITSIFSLLEKIPDGAGFLFVVGLFLVLVTGIASLLLSAGFMGSIELILLGKGWIVSAVLECGKLYFARFFVIIVLLFIAGIVFALPFNVMASFLGDVLNNTLSENGSHILIWLNYLVSGIVKSALMLLTTFAFSCVIIDNLKSIDSIWRGFRIILANKLDSMYLWIMLCVPIFLVGRMTGYFFPLSWFFNLIISLIRGYLYLALMASIMYFVLQVKRRHSETATR